MKSGWIEALHSHFLLSLDNVGLVESSSAAMADVRSEMLDVVVVAVLPPCGVDAPD